MLHLDRYGRGPIVAFECSDGDAHVPPDGAERFKAALAERHPTAAERVSVTRHPRLGQLEGARDAAVLDACVRWLTAPGR